MSSLQPIRGTHDLLPEDQRLHRLVCETAYEIAARYGYQEISTPIFEKTEVFARTLGDTSDIVTKEMYTFEDRNGATALPCARKTQRGSRGCSCPTGYIASCH